MTWESEGGNLKEQAGIEKTWDSLSSIPAPMTAGIIWENILFK